MWRSLILLWMLRAGASYRRAFRRMRTARGAFLYGFGFLLMGLWLASLIVPFVIGHGLKGAGQEPHFAAELQKMLGISVRTSARFGVSSVLFLLCALIFLLPGKRHGIPFQLAEVDFLFTGPFTRRQVLAYKIGEYSLRALPTGLIFGLLSIMISKHWISVLIGTLLIINFLLLFTLAMEALHLSVVVRLYTRLRKIALAILGIAFVSALWSFMPRSTEQGTALLRSLTESRVFQALLLPFDPFGRALTATNGVDLALWGSLAFAIDLGLFALILRLDADYQEASMSVSQTLYERQQSLRRGLSFAAGGVSAKAARRTIPDLPQWGGVGPILWRQVLTATRARMMYIFAIPLVLLVLAEVFGGTQIGEVTIPISCMLVMFMGMGLHFDFRGDIDVMEWLKQYPAPAWRIALAQLLTPALLASGALALLLGISAVASGAWMRLFAVLALAPPASLMLVGVDNAVFLLWPARITLGQATDFQAMARMYLEMFVKILLLGVGFAVAGSLGAASYYLFGHSWAAAILGACPALAAEAAVVVMVVARLFEAFDPSTDTPA